MNKVLLRFNHFLLLIAGLILPILGMAQTTVIISTPGAGTWTVPCGVTSVTIAVYGGGGGGGGSNTTANAGGGGGAGGYAQAVFAVTPGQNIAYLVGAGGAGGAPANNGSPGGQTNVFGGTLFALGGTGGGPATLGGLGGAGGTASLWTTNATGGTGSSTVPASGIGGNGGAAGGPNGGSGGVGGGAGISGGAGSAFGGGGGGGGKKSGSSNPSGGAGSSGAVVITYTSSITQPNAGADMNLCGVSSLSGNTPDAGWTGTWSVVSGSATVTSPNSPTSGFTGLAAGACATFRWTFTMAGCTTMSDDVTICLPVICNDDPCGAIPIAVSTSCSYTQYSNTGSTASTGMVEPGCGNYDDNDVWFTVTVPANGTVTLQALDNGAAGNVYPAIAVYEGTCSNLSHAGCVQTTSTLTPSQMTYNGTPGSTIYVRVWDYLDSENGFGLCAFTNTNPQGNVLPGSTSVTCGTPMTFMDPGGTGNYSVNSSADYVICPDTPGQFVSINFTQFALENGFDRVTILDGSGNGAPIIGQWTGTNNPGTITSSAADGCLTVIFQSDNIVANTGWVATVTCTSTAGTNTYMCSPTNCSGECGQWICQDGLYPTNNNGNAIEDLALGTSGCFGTAGEIASRWFYFTVLTDGTIEFSFDGPNGQDYDFAVWGPSTDGIPPCPFNTGEGPIRCSFAAVGNTGNPVGLNAALSGGEQFEGVEGNGWVDALYATAGQTYAMVLNIYMNGNPQPEIDLTIGGTGTLDCTPVFQPVEIHSLAGINQGDRNYVSWITASERDNDYFTLERSVNAVDWEYAGTVDGAGNSMTSKYYGLHDHTPYFPITYYRVKQTDFNGAFSYTEVIAVNADRQENGALVSEVYPNPADGYTAFIYTGETVSQANPLNLRVMDEQGQLVMNYNYVELASGAPSTLRTSDLAAGSYTMIFTQGSIVEKKRLVIVR